MKYLVMSQMTMLLDGVIPMGAVATRGISGDEYLPTSEIPQVVKAPIGMTSAARFEPESS